MIHRKLEHALAGFQAGMLGGLAMLGLLVSISILDRHSWSSYLTVLGALLWGPRVLPDRAGWPAVSGAALELLIAATAGVLFGIIFSGAVGSRRIGLIAVAWGAALFYVTDWLFRVTSPVVSQYLPRTALLVGHLVYGICLAAIGWIANSGERNQPGTIMQP